MSEPNVSESFSAFCLIQNHTFVSFASHTAFIYGKVQIHFRFHFASCHYPPANQLNFMSILPFTVQFGSQKLKMDYVPVCLNDSQWLKEQVRQ